MYHQLITFTILCDYSLNSFPNPMVPTMVPVPLWRRIYDDWSIVRHRCRPERAILSTTSLTIHTQRTRWAELPASPQHFTVLQRIKCFRRETVAFSFDHGSRHIEVKEFAADGWAQQVNVARGLHLSYPVNSNIITKCFTPCQALTVKMFHNLNACNLIEHS